MQRNRPIECDFVRRGSYCVCTRPECRRRIPKSEHPCDLHHARCRTTGPLPIYLGDRVEILLSNLGITPARIIACKKACGLKPKCGCGKRKSWLNQLDKRVRRLFG